MRVHLQFQANESLPPDLYLQLKRSLSNLLVSYGLIGAVTEDRQSELEAYQRFWQWQAERLREGPVIGLVAPDDFPQTPGDAEVK